MAILLPILFSGCYKGSYISLEPGRNASCNIDSSEVVFYMFSQVYRPANGLNALPDGGKPKVLYKNISLYRFNSNTKVLKKIFDFGPLNPYRDNWSTIACCINDSIVFRLAPSLGWEYELKYPSRGIDSTIFRNYQDWFIYNIHSEQIRRYEKLDKVVIPKREISNKEIVRLTSHISMLEWGINLDVVYPQSRRKRISELIELKNNQLYRNAIIELIANDLTCNDIDKIISEMNQFVDSKRGYSRAKLLIERDSTIQKLESVRKNNSSN